MTNIAFERRGEEWKSVLAIAGSLRPLTRLRDGILRWLRYRQMLSELRRYTSAEQFDPTLTPADVERFAGVVASPGRAADRARWIHAMLQESA